MKILITGADGFIAKNLRVHLMQKEGVQLYLFSKKDSLDMLKAYTLEADFIFHLAGVNRPKDTKEFYEGNRDLTLFLTNVLLEAKKATPIVFSSSTQVELNNDYGKSKKEAEDILLKYADTLDAVLFIYRLSNVFGKFSKPNYNTVIATWCHNIANSLDAVVDDETKELNLLYVDDVIKSFLDTLDALPTKQRYFEVSPVYTKSLGEILSLLYEFKNSRQTLVIPEVGSGFKRALYATYLSFLPKDNFAYDLKGHKDVRGTFYEVLKTKDSGQFSISTTAAGVARGGHYHHTKNEKFIVIKGKALIKLRGILEDDIIKYEVSSDKIKVVEMIPGYTHTLQNIGDEELVLLMWANENFDQNNPDTYVLEV